MEKLKRQLNKSKEVEYDYMAKIVIIGNSAVGKTNILLRFINENYTMAHTPTIGVDFRSKVIEVPLKNKSDKKRIKLQLWDTAGQ
jgi:small GTP-binding protein